MSAACFLSDAAERPDNGTVLWAKTGDGVRVRVGLWPEGTRGTVLMFPGRTEYIEKYGPAARDMAARGYASATIDWRGQGLADRLLDNPLIGHVGRFADYQQDVAALIAAVREHGLPEPYYLMAHSMGGAIALRALLEGLPVRAAVFSAPMWGILFDPAILRPVAWSLSTLSRFSGLGHRGIPGVAAESYVATTPFADNVLTHDAEMFALMQGHLAQHPQLALAQPSYTWLNEALRDVRSLRAAPKPTLRVWITLGDREQVVDPNAIHSVAGRWNSAELTLLPKCRHEILMETAELRAVFYDRAAEVFAAA